LLVEDNACTHTHTHTHPPPPPTHTHKATKAFNRTALGLNIATDSDVYTCDGDICWETRPDFDSGDVAW
jgi:hypothetical protein